MAVPLLVYYFVCGLLASYTVFRLSPTLIEFGVPIFRNSVDTIRTFHLSQPLRPLLEPSYKNAPVNEDMPLTDFIPRLALFALIGLVVFKITWMLVSSFPSAASSAIRVVQATPLALLYAVSAIPRRALVLLFFAGVATMTMLATSHERRLQVSPNLFSRMLGCVPLILQTARAITTVLDPPPLPPMILQLLYILFVLTLQLVMSITRQIGSDLYSLLFYLAPFACFVGHLSVMLVVLCAVAVRVTLAKFASCLHITLCNIILCVHAWRAGPQGHAASISHSLAPSNLPRVDGVTGFAIFLFSFALGSAGHVHLSLALWTLGSTLFIVPVLVELVRLAKLMRPVHTSTSPHNAVVAPTPSLDQTPRASRIQLEALLSPPRVSLPKLLSSYIKEQEKPRLLVDKEIAQAAQDSYRMFSTGLRGRFIGMGWPEEADNEFQPRAPLRRKRNKRNKKKETRTSVSTLAATSDTDF
ncbi:hypothetical protein B0H11DRAFT_2364520 [Mycena galericulata]|nr:hypothetical protein B0H11DRAFT_2364520 [Mycena galericulata]